MVGRTGKWRLAVWWKGGLAQGTTDVIVDWNRKTSSVVIYMCVFRVRKTIPFSLEKKDHIYLIGIPMWRQN